MLEIIPARTICTVSTRMVIVVHVRWNASLWRAQSHWSRHLPNQISIRLTAHCTYRRQTDLYRTLFEFLKITFWSISQVGRQTNISSHVRTVWHCRILVCYVDVISSSVYQQRWQIDTYHQVNTLGYSICFYFICSSSRLYWYTWLEK